MTPDSRIGKCVVFRPPNDVKKRGGLNKVGEIVDEIWVPDKQKSKSLWRHYCFFAQRIHWNTRQYSIRLGYYRRRKGEDHWEFASQTTVNSNPKTIRRLLMETLSRGKWFR